MKKHKGKQILKYVMADLVSAGIAWTLFFTFRKLYLEPEKFGHPVPLEFDRNYFLGLAFIPVFWLTLYALTGSYTRIFRKNRIKELGQTLLLSIIGVIILFFLFILNDEVANYKQYYTSFFTLLGLHFGFTFLFRLILTSITVKRIHNKKIGFNTLMIGGNEKAIDIYNELQGLEQSQGNFFIGFVSLNGGSDQSLEGTLSHLGRLDDLPRILKEKEVEEVIIALESSEHREIEKILGKLESHDVIVKVIPDLYDIMSGSVKMSSILGAPLIEIDPHIMPEWQRSLKRILDITLSLLALTLLSPLLIALAIIIKTTSKGPVIYAQERVGMHNRPFKILKLRTMVQDAETNGPQLSSKNDPRVTRIGRFLRKTRLDEIPQFINVLKGDMSLVGPRPERRYFIDRITEKAPHYKHLLKVKPGITSWGMVKFGYAENVDEMIERSKYDILYIENMSLAVDFKIMIYTILTVIKGKGK